MKARGLGKVFAIAAMVGGLAIAAWGVRSWQASLQSKSWPTVPGVIVESGVEKDLRRGGAKTDGKGVHRMRLKYVAKVRYDYEVDGTTRSGSRLSFNDYASSNREQIEAIAGAYAEGQEVVVHYDPQDPGRCVLQTGFSWVPVAITAMGSLFAVLGVMSLRSAKAR